MEAGVGQELTPLQRLFFVFPLLASDRMAHQQRVHPVLERLITQAAFHRETELRALFHDLRMLNERNILLLERFRRFPHRALQLGHGLTDDEKEFVSQYDWQPWL
jgi:uncharacterized protein (DUF924 family)